MTTTSIDARSLPRPLRRGLEAIDRKLRALSVVRGLGTLAIVMAALAAAGMAADFLWPLPIAARWTIWGTWVAAGIVLSIKTLIPIVRRSGYTDLAAVAERGNPDLGERISSAVELLAGTSSPHGSPAFIAALGDEAAKRSETTNLGVAVTGKKAAIMLAMGLVAGGLVVLPSFLKPDPFRTLAQRFLMPWSNLDRAAMFVVNVAPGDAVVALGSDVKVMAKVSPRFGATAPPSSANLEWTGSDGKPHRVAMTPAEVGSGLETSFNASVPRVSESLLYRVFAGTAESRRHTIRAVEPPSVTALSALITPPSYTKRTEVTARNAARIEAFEGSRITITLTPSKPLAKATMEWPAKADGSPRSVDLTSIDSGMTWTGVVQADFSGNYAFAIADPDQIMNRPEPPRRVIVRPDAPPSVGLGGSPDPKDAQGDDLLVVDISARDDVAVMTSELLYEIARAASTSSQPNDGTVTAAMQGLGSRSARGEASLSLKALELRSGDMLSYRVRVTDNRPEPKGPNVTYSSPRALRIVDKAEPLLARERSIERQSLQDALNAIKKSAAENRQTAEALRYAADSAQRGNGEWSEARQTELTRREAEARAVVDRLQVLSREFTESGQFAPLARPAKQVADVEAEGGREKLDEARRATEPAKRLASLRSADDALASTQKRLDELQAKFDELARLDDDRRKLRELAEQQDELARKADELADHPDPAAIEPIQQEQDRLRGQVDQIAARSPELKAEALAARVKEAEELAKQARALAERQREEARKTADPSGRAEKLKQIAAEQKRLEDDARRFAMQVDRTLQENGRGAVDTGSIARAVDPIERGEIEQSRQQLDAAEGALRRLARDLDDVRDDPKTMLRRLAFRQDILTNQVAEIVRDAQRPEQKKALAEKLKPFAEREQAIRKLAAAVPVPDLLKGQANAALQSLDQATEDLNTNQHEQVQAHQNEARARLAQLADALPDRNQFRQQVNQAVNEAKARTTQVAQELENHLRDTAAKPGQKDFDPEAAARELARRVAPLADRQAEAVRLLATVQPERNAQPQHDRALQRGRKLADALDALRDAALPDSKPGDATPNADWRILAAFDDAKSNPPFAIDRPIDLKAPFNGRKGTHPTWKPVQAGPDGRVDLGALYSRDSNQSAFAYAEIMSPIAGKGRLLVGSDDFLTIWLNGKRVYDFNQPRSWSAAQDRVEVTFTEGPNRLLVRCGNGSDQWIFSVAVLPPKGAEQSRPVEVVERLRESLPALKLDALASVDRLVQKLQGQEPADDVATALAEDLKAIQAEPQASDDLQRVGTALRNLQVPDALAIQAEAIRQAERAAVKTAENAPDAAQAREQAAKSADVIARKLTDSVTVPERAAALAQAQKGLNEPDATRDMKALAQAQKAIANELAALPTDSAAKAPAVNAATRAAELADRQAQRPDAAPSPEEMTQARAEAAKAIDALARMPAEPAAPAKPNDAGSPREQAKALAARQHALADQARTIKPQGDDPAAKAKADAALEALANDQKAIAETARALPDPLPSGSDQRRNAEERRDAARASQAKAANAMTAHQPQKAAERADEAAKALDQLAEALPETGQPQGFDPRAVAPPDPDLAINPEHAKEAQALARRERTIREQLQAVLGERVPPQEALRDETAALGQQLGKLREGTRDLSPRAQGPANGAADLLQNQAPNVMNQGLQQLGAGQPAQARETQRRAAEILERAGQQAEDVANALRSEVPAEALAQAQAQAQGQGENAPAEAGVGSAREAQRQASQQLAQARESPSTANGPAAQGAGEAMRQAARGLRAAASQGQSSRGSKPGSEPGQATAESSNRDPKEGEAGRDDPHLAELKEAIKTKTGRNWGELPGHLRSEILQMSQGKYRDDYARLIGLYFREIAAGRDETKEAKP